MVHRTERRPAIIFQVLGTKCLDEQWSLLGIVIQVQVITAICNDDYFEKVQFKQIHPNIDPLGGFILFPFT